MKSPSQFHKSDIAIALTQMMNYFQMEMLRTYIWNQNATNKEFVFDCVYKLWPKLKGPKEKQFHIESQV